MLPVPVCSWQFGDGTSTYQCKQADYLITVY